LVGNVGTSPATNLTLILNTTDKFTNITNLHSDTDIFLRDDKTQLKHFQPQKVNNSVIELYSPRLVHGDGSYIELLLSFDKGTTVPDPNFRTDIVLTREVFGQSTKTRYPYY
jgi:hypothetical protein